MLEVRDLSYMNYLAHIFFADRTPLSIFGNLLGDFVKGKITGKFPKKLESGIINHRKIDKFTDSHATTFSSRKFIRTERYRFSGIIVDVAYDHFLSKNWNRFSSVELTEFIDSTYELMENEPPGIDNDTLIHLRKMRAEDWLSSYSSIEGIDKAFKRISARIKRKNSLGSAIEDIVENCLELENNFLRFFPELICFINERD